MLRIDEAPAIRGIRLGMPISEVKALYSGIAEQKLPDEAGASVIVFPRGGGERLKGIDSLFLNFFGGRVFYIHVEYERSHWQEATELTKWLDLPNKEYAKAECQGFTAVLIRLSVDQTLSLSLTDTVAERKFISRLSEMKKNAADCQKAPVIRGVTLGMPVTQYRTLYPHAQQVRKRIDVGELVFRNVNGADPRLKGISDLWTYFLDGALYFVAVDYTNQIEWNGIDQFVERFSKPLGLRTKWEDGPTSDSRMLRCHSFVVTAKMSAGHPQTAIQDRAAAVKLNKREKQLKSPGSFRP
jgi:hypothetical protein